ncbi:MAG: Holliday junction resolvase RuvX [Actinomycetota bacterium]
MTTIIGVDLGSKRIGLAMASTNVATPLEVIDRTGDDNADAKRIASIAREHEAGTIVIGHPKRLDGTEGPAANAASCFADILRGVDSEMSVVLFDERLTTKQAERVLIDAGARRAARRKVVDKLAATVILQSYLDAGRL